MRRQLHLLRPRQPLRPELAVHRVGRAVREHRHTGAVADALGADEADEAGAPVHGVRPRLRPGRCVRRPPRGRAIRRRHSLLQGGLREVRGVHVAERLRPHGDVRLRGAGRGAGPDPEDRLGPDRGCQGLRDGAAVRRPPRGGAVRRPRVLLRRALRAVRSGRRGERRRAHGRVHVRGAIRARGGARGGGARSSSHGGCELHGLRRTCVPPRGGWQEGDGFATLRGRGVEPLARLGPARPRRRS
mmetsp:Transcript_26785/g.80692  ORF Transcript_26785/g.80692 Transcript_26785/m.80692 type:complete len:244 (-) Transcript_26785:486-1217(-)